MSDETTSAPSGDDSFHDTEVAYWRDRAEALEKRVRQLTELDTALPPEPPVGTVYFNNHGVKTWDRRDDGWYCMRSAVECLNCPCEWIEAWDFGLRYGGGSRRLP